MGHQVRQVLSENDRIFDLHPDLNRRCTEDESELPGCARKNLQRFRTMVSAPGHGSEDKIRVTWYVLMVRGTSVPRSTSLSLTSSVNASSSLSLCLSVRAAKNLRRRKLVTGLAKPIGHQYNVSVRLCARPDSNTTHS